MKKIFSLFILFAISVFAFANEYKVDGVYPTNWWVGMKEPKLQLILRGANIAENNFSINYTGVKLFS